jgi:hypothetical protein
MKKFLTVLLCFAMIFVLTLPAAAIVNVTANKATIVIDGVKDDDYAGPIAVASRMRDENGEYPQEPNVATAQAWFAWDSTALYFYIDVTDKTPNHDDFNAESVEIFLDLESGQGEADEASDDKPFWQLRVSPNDPETLGGYSRDDGGANWSTSAFEDLVEWKLIPKNNYKDGYIIEMKVGVPSFSKFTEGKVIPFDLQVCDNSQGDGRDGQMFLDSIGEGIHDNERWHVAAYLMGRLTLGPKYEAPAAAVVEPEAPVVAAPEAPKPPPAVRTGDAGIMILVAVMAAAGIVILRKKAVK